MIIDDYRLLRINTFFVMLKYPAQIFLADGNPVIFSVGAMKTLQFALIYIIEWISLLN